MSNTCIYHGFLGTNTDKSVIFKYDSAVDLHTKMTNYFNSTKGKKYRVNTSRGFKKFATYLLKNKESKHFTLHPYYNYIFINEITRYKLQETFEDICGDRFEVYEDEDENEEPDYESNWKLVFDHEEEDEFSSNIAKEQADTYQYLNELRW